MVHKQINVNFDGNKYPIIIGNYLTPKLIVNAIEEKTNNLDIVIVYDEFLKKEAKQLRIYLCCFKYNIHLYPIKAGKENKTLEQTTKLWNFLETKKFSPDSTIISIGGGVIGDLVGLVASMYLRGINLVHIPTTLTAMVDSSVGGKVAVNYGNTINAIGTYYHPILNLIDIKYLDTLPLRDLNAGMAEVIKSAIMYDKKLFNKLCKYDLRATIDSLLYAITRSIEIKIKHVQGDVHEKNKRLKLNFGHTMGHAIEITTGETFKHGEGVSLGLVGATFMACHYFKNFIPWNSYEELLLKYGLPIKIDTKKIGWTRKKIFNKCMENIHRDKKKKDNKLRFVLSDKIGRCKVVNDIPDNLIKEAFKYLII